MKRSFSEVANDDDVNSEHSTTMGWFGQIGNNRSNNTNNASTAMHALCAIPVFECLCEYVHLGDIVHLFSATRQMRASVWNNTQHVVRQTYATGERKAQSILPTTMQMHVGDVYVDYLRNAHYVAKQNHSSANYDSVGFLFHRSLRSPKSFNPTYALGIRSDTVMLLCTGAFKSPREAMRHELMSAVFRNDVLHATRLVHHYGVHTSFANHLCLRLAVENLDYCMCDMLLKRDAQGMLANKMQWIRILDNVFTRKCSVVNRGAATNICLLFFRHMSPIHYFTQQHACLLHTAFIEQVVLPVAATKYPRRNSSSNEKLHKTLENSLKDVPNKKVQDELRANLTRVDGEWGRVHDEARQYLKHTITSNTSVWNRAKC